MNGVWPTFGPLWMAALFLLLISFARADEEGAVKAKGKEGDGKMLAVFQIMTFPNENCEGSSRNGTCYTAEECSNRGGSSSGECAQGFGVCCIFTLSCGESSSENCTYLVQASTTTFTTDVCSYTICKCDANVCRIRFDFTTMNIDGPVTGTTSGSAGKGDGTIVGDCTSDSIMITGSGGSGAPVICGTNTGQHLYVDATDECHTVNVNTNRASTNARTWDVKVTQYACGSEMGGPPGCLQYFTGISGTFASFNFPTGATVGNTATHLSSQDYRICFRRNSGRCYICYAPIIGGSTIDTAQNTFGLSISTSGTIAQSQVGTECFTDFLEIPGGNTIAIAMDATIVANGIQRFCGRIFTITTANIATATVCTRRIPFEVRFVADDDEVITNAAPAGTATTSESDEAPGGIVGFKMAFTQGTC